MVEPERVWAKWLPRESALPRLTPTQFHICNIFDALDALDALAPASKQHLNVDLTPEVN